MNRGNIIVLNGVSSSGKSTLSKLLAEQLKNYFHFSIDHFDQIIESMEERDDENGRLIPIPTEFFFHDNIKMFSNYGIHLIVDQILFNEETMEDFLSKLYDYPVLFVGVHCSEEELERREIQRGDRPVGQGKGQLRFVHQQQEVYDVEAHTETDTIEVCVERVLEELQRIDTANGIRQTYENWQSRNK